MLKATTARQRVRWVDVALDAFAWAVALVAAALLSLDGSVSARSWLSLVILAIAASIVQFGFGTWLSLYNYRFVQGSFQEFRAQVASVLASGVVLALPAVIFADALDIPRSTIAIAVPIALLLLGIVRYTRRLRAEAEARPSGTAQPTLVYGAGYLGRNLVRVMLTDRDSPYRVVGLVDDDPDKRMLRVDGVPVIGSFADLPSVVAATGATAIVVSIARANGRLLSAVADAASDLGLRVLVFPSLEEVLEGKSRLRDVRDIGIEDLIGRQPVDTDVESMAGYLRGKRILVTGAGGSIGSELCRQISKYSPDELIMLDRDETGLQATQLLLEGHGLLMNENIVLADIRDPAALAEVFERCRPQVIFHAAALKHLPMLERFPDEAWKTNVIGTLNVLNAARAVGVETFVNVSTDKAANPTSVLGRSKRLAERLTAWAAEQNGHSYLSVRFGNVLGSRGSLVPVFAAMIEAGGPLTVTDRDVTRFFMSIPEACHLVVQAGGIGGPGEVLVLDMGEPVRILDIAERMIAQSGRDIAIVFTGLREGEKLHEELIGEGESTERPVHPKISHASVTPIGPTELDVLTWNDAAKAETSR